MGKTTLLRTLMGLLKPKHGSGSCSKGVEVTGSHASMNARAASVVVPGGTAFFLISRLRRTSCSPSVRGRLARVDWTRAAVYEIFPASGRAPQELGQPALQQQQQMLTIGRALLSNPSIVLIDEATDSLAPKVRDDIWSTLASYGEKGSPSSSSTNVDNLVELAERHVVLAKGEVLFEGTSKQLRAQWEFVEPLARRLARSSVNGPPSHDILAYGCARAAIRRRLGG